MWYIEKRKETRDREENCKKAFANIEVMVRTFLKLMYYQSESSLRPYEWEVEVRKREWER